MTILSQRYRKEGRAKSIISTEEIVPTPKSNPTVAIEFCVDIRLMTKPQHMSTEPELKMVGIAKVTDEASASVLFIVLRSAT